MESIKIPVLPQFLFAPDADSSELYIVCTSPMALIWVKQSIPAQLYILEGPKEESILRSAADFYRENASKTLNQN